LDKGAVRSGQKPGHDPQFLLRDRQYFSTAKIAVSPGDVFGIGDAETTKGKKPNQLSARF
jgi:hypothetical protein